MTYKILRFMLFMNCNMIDGIDGINYDQPACGGFTIRVNSGIVFEQFIEIVGSSVCMDIRISDIEIIYRHPNLTPSGLIRFMSFPIPNEQAMKTMFSIAMPIPNMVHLYVNVSRVGLDINLNSKPFGQLEDRTQVIIPDFELVASSVYDDEEMVANNEYMDFRTKIDDEFEEFDFDGR
uniref:Uncharacterized protein n=1 Tax=Cucumis melo TaxID=3656 RepID=A0A9I9EKP0_CUCME